MHWLLKKSLRKQIIIGVSLIHAVLIFSFVLDLVVRQSRFLHQESEEIASGLAQTLATNSIVWTLSKDYAGLQEVVLAQKKYPNVKMAMVYSLDGKILAHSDTDKIGLFIDATKNPRLLSAADKDFMITRKGVSVSSIKNIELKGVVLGKVWIVLGEEKFRQTLEQIIRDGFLYTLGAIFIGAVFAWVVTNTMTKRLKKLAYVAESVKRGERTLRVRLPPGDELGQLGEAFDSMLDALEFKEKVLEKSQAEARRANQAKTDFLANMSHEIRTPINTMVGVADVLAETSLTEEQSKFVKIFQSAGENLTHLVNDILDLSKIEAGELKIKEELFSIPDLFNDISMLCAENAINKKLDLRFKINTDVPAYIVGDKNRIRQVLVNFLSNSLKFTERGSVTVVATRLAESGRNPKICYSVEDTGIGIPEDKKGILFERFQQVDVTSSRKTGGTGLGLAISKKLVEVMGGQIGFESHLGLGSKFFFTLPLKEVSKTEGLPKDEGPSASI